MMCQVDLTPAFLRDFENLYKSNDDFNVILKVGPDTFKAHSLILKARSGYLRNAINEYFQRKSIFSVRNDHINLDICDIPQRVFKVCF